MATLAQSAATFVAILAGFYTTKIISISSEKKKIEQKVHEIENEIRWRTKRSVVLNNKKQEILQEGEEKSVNWFIEWVTTRPFFAENIDSEENIIKSFTEVLGVNPTEYQKKVLKDNAKSIVEKARKTVKERYTPKTDVISLVGSRTSETDKIRGIMESRDEKKTFEEIIQGINEERSKIEFLEEQHHTYNTDLDSLIYPKQMKFGFFFGGHYTRYT